MKRSLNEAYKSWRNKVRKYSLVSIVDRALQVLHAHAPDNVEELRKAPWLLLLMVKWACQDRMVHLTRGQPISMGAMDNLRQDLWDFPKEIDNHISEDRPSYLFLRQLLRPQVDLQRRVTLGFVREAALLASQPENSRLRKVFTERTGLAVEAFIDLAFCTYTAILEGRRDFGVSFFGSLRSAHGDALDRFIALVSTDLNGLVAFFRSLPDVDQRLTSELFEFPLIRRYPFLRVGDRLVCWYPAVFFRGMEDIVHAVMKESGHTYIEGFSKLFERHVVVEAKAHTANCYDETELINFVPPKTKVTDALLSFPGANVFIEAKAGMFDESVMVVGHSKILRSKTSMLGKAIEQARSASLGIQERLEAPQQVLEATEEFLLVVTSKELSVGRGDRLLSMYGERLDATSMEGSIPLAHVYFLSIEDYERLMRGLDKLNIDLPGFLRRCVKRDGAPETSVMYFEQHLDGENFPYELSTLVEEAIHSSEERLKRALPRE